MLCLSPDQVSSRGPVLASCFSELSIGIWRPKNLRPAPRIWCWILVNLDMKHTHNDGHFNCTLSYLAFVCKYILIFSSSWEGYCLESFAKLLLYHFLFYVISFLFHPFTPKISWVILLTVCHLNFYDVSLEKLLFDELINPLCETYLYLHHLSAWDCLDIVRRNSVMATHGI